MIQHEPPGKYTEQEVAAMFRAVTNLLARWAVSEKQAAVLLNAPCGTLAAWKARGEPINATDEVADRMGALLGIHAALRTIFREPEQGHAWVAKPNLAFDGRSALEVMLTGLPGLQRVRVYLASVVEMTDEYEPPADLVALVRRMVEESGDPEGFDAVAWLADWMQRPVPALGNRTPLSFMDSEEGRALVKQILMRMQSGAYS